MTLAYGWACKLERGHYKSAKEIAESNGLSERYVWKIRVSLNLAPDIVESILAGAQPTHLALRRVNEIQLSLN